MAHHNQEVVVNKRIESMSSNGPGSGASSTDGTSQPRAASNLAATYGTIDGSDVSKQIWMARVPPKLSAAWADAPEGTVLGTLTFTKGGGPAPPRPSNNNKKQPPNRNIATAKNNTAAKQSLTVSVSPEFANSDLPLGYSIEAMTKKVPVLHPFTRQQDGSVKLHGTVVRSCNLQMRRTDEYRKLCKNRLVATVSSNRFVRPVDAGELSMKNRRPVGTATGGEEGFGGAVQRFGKRMIEASEGKNENNRKRKFEGQPIRSVIFELFSQQPFWTVRELCNESGRLEKELRKVLRDLCEFRNRGEHKGMWELKAEFREQGTG
mmetsp:Transcript_7560/g.10268  ORF Transcript_7560/g.10268 Transcript_7560/m.10268 type:complete len:320 (-) Transcript_7560:201-1160(-)